MAWVLDVFVSEPLLALLLGKTKFYRFRPYFYEYRLGKIYKELKK
jgi:hypothetical protein